MKRIGLLLMAALLAGCVAIEYEPVTLDSPPPEIGEQTGRCPEELMANQQCVAQIRANAWMSRTRIHAKEGEHYCVTVPPDQVWFDKGRRNTPPLGEKGSWIMRLSKKREPHPFFNLMIAVDPIDKKSETKVKARAVDKPNDFRFIAESRGEIVLYPNDAIGSASYPERWYRNNSGYIWVTIKRCS